MGGGELLLAGLGGALVVLAGAAYAALFALARLRNSRWLDLASYGAYAVLVAAAGAMSSALHLAPAWLGVLAVALIGYLMLPRAIWQLCVGTHAAESLAQNKEMR